RRGAAEGRFDDIAGRGFLILARGIDPSRVLDAADRSFWQSLGGSVVTLADASAADAVVDSEGFYGKLMDEYRCDIIVKRPDYNIFGTCRAAGLKTLLADLRAQLGAGWGAAA